MALALAASALLTMAEMQKSETDKEGKRGEVQAKQEEIMAKRASGEVKKMRQVQQGGQLKEKEEVTMVVSFPFSALQMPGCGFPDRFIHNWPSRCHHHFFSANSELQKLSQGCQDHHPHPRKGTPMFIFYLFIIIRTTTFDKRQIMPKIHVDIFFFDFIFFCLCKQI